MTINIVPLNWSKVVESPVNGRDTELFFTYNPYKARIHMVQSHNGVVVRKAQSSIKTHILFRGTWKPYREGKYMAHSNIYEFSLPLLPFHWICSIRSQAPLSIIPLSLSLNRAPNTCVFPLFTSSFPSLVYINTTLLPVIKKKNKTTSFLRGKKREEIGQATVELFLVIWEREEGCRHSHKGVFMSLSTLPARKR